jgi:predicted N-acetyltransferase YhbS
MSQTIRSVLPDELPAWFEAFGSAFYFWPFDPHVLAALRRDTFDIERIVGAFEDDGAIVGTFRTFESLLTLPGGARVPVNAVSGVSVRPTHRRRGTLTALNADDVRRSVSRGDAASILISAEWPIYGRFGYGPATWQSRWTLRTRGGRARPGAVRHDREHRCPGCPQGGPGAVRPGCCRPARRDLAPGVPLG